MTLGLSLYRAAAGIAAPLVERHVRRRADAGKEDPARLDERLGRAAVDRPDGSLVWVHAASVGEALSALPMIEEIEARGARCLLTTGTITSAALLAKRAPDLLHRFVPVDTPAAVAGFLDAWRPDAALWMESELWPNLVTGASARGIPMALVNARLSRTSRRNWGFARRSAAALLGAFSVRLVQTEQVRERLLSLGADPVTTHVTGDLKASRVPDPVDGDALASMRAALAGRPVWLAASTHPGDEAAAMDAHIASGIEGLCTIIAPRHPERAAEIVALARERGLSVSTRSAGQGIGGDVYVADTLGELSLWYALVPVALIGGGWDGIGGHNPLEAAPHGCAILSGDDVPSFADTYARLVDAGAVRLLPDRAGLAVALGDVMDASGLTTEGARMAAAAREAGAPDPQPLARTMAGLEPVLAGVVR
jgi:3-deoxy-D-manno-octulosonic-acid transferase